MAAANSLRNGKPLVRDLVHAPRPGSEGVCLALYDALLDDGEDVRDTAAQVGTFALYPRDPSGIPYSLASHLTAAAVLKELLVYLVREATLDQEIMMSACISRITGADYLDAASLFEPLDDIVYSTPFQGPQAALPPVRDQLSEALVHDTALFVEENPNLYMDPAQEAGRWAHVLRARTGAHPPPAIAAVLRPWVRDGLAALVETAEARMGGPLGWTSDARVFVLGTRVLAMTDVVVGWTPCAELEGSSGDVQAEIVRLSTRLHQLGPERRLHRNWRLRVKSIITKVSGTSAEDGTVAHTKS